MRVRCHKSKTVEEALAQEIRLHFQLGDLLPSEQDLARQFSVSKKTVHRALENLKAFGMIRSEPRRGNYAVPPPPPSAPPRAGKILYAKRERPHGLTPLRQQRLVDMWDDYMLMRLRECGLTVTLVPAHEISEGTLSSKQLSDADGFLFAGTTCSITEATQELYWSKLRDLPGVIFMKAEALPLPCSQVGLDLEYASRLILEQTRRFPVEGCMLFCADNPNNLFRGKVFRRNAEKMGLSVHTHVLSSHQNVYARALEFSEQCRNKLVLSTSDMLSPGIYEGLQRQRLRPSVDFHLCSIDDMENLDCHPFPEPRITSIRYDRRKICDTALDDLLRQLQAPGAVESSSVTLMRSELVIRESGFMGDGTAADASSQPL